MHNVKVLYAYQNRIVILNMLYINYHQVILKLQGTWLLLHKPMLNFKLHLTRVFHHKGFIAIHTNSR